MNYIFWAVAFTYINFSEFSWNLFNQLGGSVWAKIGPEIISILFYILAVILLLKKDRVSFDPKQFKSHFLPVLAIFCLTFITRLQEFKLYFFKEDIFNYLFRDQVLYSFGPWISSHPALITEIVRYFSGYNPSLYQFTLIISHSIFSISVYMLAVYFSGNKTLAFLSGIFFSITTLHFEEFHWLIHPINYGWQAFVMALAIIALAWQIKKNPKNIPLISAFLMMMAVGSGMAKTAPFFIVLGAIDIIVTFPRFTLYKILPWLGWFVKRQSVIWGLMFVFLSTRLLLTEGGASRSELITAPYYKIFFWLLGSYTLPPELMHYLVVGYRDHQLSFIITLVGSITGLVGVIIFLLFCISVTASWYRKTKLPLVVEIGIAWLLINTAFNTFYGPHIPVTEKQLVGEIGPAHIAYPPVVGTSLLYGYLIWQLLTRSQNIFQKFFNRKIAVSISGLILLGIFLLMAFSLRSFYVEWLGMAKGAKVTSPQFFFESYMKFIPKNARLINIFYDDDAKKRADNYKPSVEFIQGFWNKSKINILYGEQELKDAITSWHKEGTYEDNINNLYYIYTDYPKGIVQNLSLDLKSQILGDKQELGKWEVLIGEEKDGWLVPILSQSDKLKDKFYLPVIVSSERFRYPAVLSPRLDIKVVILQTESSFKPDIRADIMSGLLVHDRLIEKNDLDSAAEYTISHSEENKNLSLTKVLRMSSVAGRIINPEEVIEGKGNWILIVGLSGENINFDASIEKKNLQELFREYSDLQWRLAYIPEGISSKDFSFKLSSSGAFLNRLLIVPISKEALALRLSGVTISNSNLHPKIINL